MFNTQVNKKGRGKILLIHILLFFKEEKITKEIYI